MRDSVLFGDVNNTCAMGGVLWVFLFPRFNLCTLPLEMHRVRGDHFSVDLASSQRTGMSEDYLKPIRSCAVNTNVNIPPCINA